MMRPLACLALLGACVAARPACADVAPPRPEDLTCARGAVARLPEVDPDARHPDGRPVQPWPYCAPSTCESDDDCEPGRACSEEEIALCVEDAAVEGATVRRARRRGCEPDRTCLAEDAECEVARRCVDRLEAPLFEEPAETAAAEDPLPAPAGAADPTAPEETPDPADPGIERAPASADVTPDGCGCRAVVRGAPPLEALGLLLCALARRRRSAPRPASAGGTRWPSC